jgi:hypothetical protein
MADKLSHFGMAGHYAAMSEFLLRGYNVAIPSVDVGDDVFVVDDRLGTLWRVQVKTGDASNEKQRPKGRREKSVLYNLSRRQLREAKANELFFMLMVRWVERWRFLLIPRVKLLELREQFVVQDRSDRRGRRPKADEDAQSDVVGLYITWTDDDASGWAVSLRSYMNAWPRELPLITDGPGSRSRGPLP